MPEVTSIWSLQYLGQLAKCISHPWSATVYLRAYRQRRTGWLSFSQILGHSLCIMWGSDLNGEHSLSTPFGWVGGNGFQSRCKTCCMMRFLVCQIQKMHVRTIILEIAFDAVWFISRWLQSIWVWFLVVYFYWREGLVFIHFPDMEWYSIWPYLYNTASVRILKGLRGQYFLLHKTAHWALKASWLPRLCFTTLYSVQIVHKLLIWQFASLYSYTCWEKKRKKKTQVVAHQMKLLKSTDSLACIF